MNPAFPVLATAMLIAMKSTGQTDWTWPWVFSPVVGYFAGVGFAYVFYSVRDDGWRPWR